MSRFNPVVCLLGISVFAFVLTGGFKTKEVDATETCNQQTVYTKSDDFDDFRVNINFTDGDQKVIVTAKSGYSLVSLWYDWQGDGESDLDDQWTVDSNPETIDPSGSKVITDVQVTVKKFCATATPTPTRTPCPTATPRPTATPSATPTPSEEATPTPEATLGPVGGGEEVSTSTSNEGNKTEGCSDAKPETTTLLSVERSADRKSVKLTWLKKDSASNYSISYGESSGSYIYGVPETGNVDNFTIGALDPRKEYSFAVRTNRGCMPGDLSNEITTGATTVTVPGILAGTSSMPISTEAAMSIVGTLLSGGLFIAGYKKWKV